jgi:tetratricopeptide (TPR) repeat protein
MAASVDELHRRAQRHLNRGEFPALIDCCKAILAQQRDFADGWFLLSVAAEAAGDLTRARDLRSRAIALAPASAEYLAQQARLLSRLNRAAEALDLARRAVAAGPGDALAFDTVGVVFSRLARYEEARAALDQAVRRAPDNAQYRFNLAAALQFLGDRAGAETHYRAAITARPDFARAWWALSELHKTGAPGDDLDTLLALAERADPGTDDALYLGHAIAREYELRGDCARAFGYLERGKAARRQRALDSRARDEALFEALRQAFTAVDQEPRTAATEGSEPLFVVGMPRTGTTLVERILSCHPAVQSLGEIQDLAHAVRRSAGASGGGAVLDPTVIDAARSAPSERTAVRYRESTAQRLEGAAPPRYLLDKMPLNALYIGFILRSLPSARVVILRRDPRDTVLSNFRQLFAVDYSYYDYHYDLATTARYVADFEGLMAHFRSLYGERLFTLDYEALVASPEPTVRALLAYLDLPWDPACLAFHTRQEGVATPSALQVRQPLYADAVARWRRYEKELAPASRVLAGAGVLPTGT